MSKEIDKLNLKIVKQVESNKKDIKEILSILKDKTPKNISVKEEPVLSDQFNIHADFNHIITTGDKQFLSQLGRDITKTLEARGVKNFVITFRK